MRKTGLYTPGVYMEHMGVYCHERGDWRKRREGKAGRYAAALFLSVVLGIATGEYAKDQRASRPAASDAEVQMISSVSGDEESLDSTTARVMPVKEGMIFPEDIPGVFVKNPEDTLVALDPGHGGADGGCSRKGIMEKDINLQIAFAVKGKLQALGYQVMLTRDSDQALTLEERVNTANRNQADIYVSIHQNADEASEAKGIELLYSSQNEGKASGRLAELIHKYTVENTGASGREIIKEEGLYVIRECVMPSCLIETGFLSNRAECGRLTDPEYQDQIAEGIASGIDLFFHPKTMYLTFDDGPSEENTALILDILKERGIKATFFVIGENVRRHPDIAKRIVEEGHTIGIHCNCHEYQTLYADVDSYLRDFQKAYDTVKEITGADAKLFRFPGGSINDYNKDVYQEIIEAMTEQGYIYYDWNASLEDATAKKEPQTLIRNAVSSAQGRKRVVMLAHDVVSQTALCLDELLEQFPEYQMKPLIEESEPVQF